MKFLKKFETLAALNTAVQNTPVDLVGLAYNNHVPVVKIAKALQGPASDEIWYTSVDGNIIDFTYAGYASGSGDDLYVINNTYENGKGILTFNEDITAVGYYGFSSYPEFSSIIMPNTVTSIVNTLLLIARDLYP